MGDILHYLGDPRTSWTTLVCSLSLHSDSLSHIPIETVVPGKQRAGEHTEPPNELVVIYDVNGFYSHFYFQVFG